MAKDLEIILSSSLSDNSHAHLLVPSDSPMIWVFLCDIEVYVSLSFSGAYYMSYDLLVLNCVCFKLAFFFH